MITVGENNASSFGYDTSATRTFNDISTIGYIYEQNIRYDISTMQQYDLFISRLS